MIQLETKIPMNDKVKPIQLPNQGEKITVGTMCYLKGEQRFPNLFLILIIANVSMSNPHWFNN